jgi:hypothetical protein
MSDKSEELLAELLVWTRFMARPALAESLTHVLKDQKHRLAYELTDGNRTQVEIGKLAGLDQTTVSDLWGRWRRLGLLNETTKRPSRLVSLVDLGWDLKLRRKST